jgi:membrane protease YdiL (CAAX protease family)
VAIPLVLAIMILSIRVFQPTPHAIEQLISRSPTWGNFMLATVSAAVIAPLQEELLFRGILMPWLRRLLGARWAIALSALIFAALHSDAWPAPLPLFVLALFLGYLAHHTNSLVGPITMHAAFNSVSMIMLAIGVHMRDNAAPSPIEPSTLTNISDLLSILFGR